MHFTKKYSIHKDYKLLPVKNFQFSKPSVFMVNSLIRCQRIPTYLKVRYLQENIFHSISSFDGTPLKIIQICPKGKTEKKEKLPALLYFHGGAFSFTYTSSHLHFVNFYAHHAHCKVFLVDYRLAPAHLYPVGFNDCYASFLWLKNHAKQLGIDPDKIILMGDSAGGGIAAGLAQKALDKKVSGIAAQVLIYPAIDGSYQSQSAQKFDDTPVWTATSNKRMWDLYLRKHPNKKDLYGSPFHRSNLKGIPKTYIETAEYDPLRDEGIQYGERLEDAGIKVVSNHTIGTVHAFDYLLSSELCKESLQKRVNFLIDTFKQS